MVKLETLIAAGEKYEASDIHLTTDQPPRLRIKGDLKTIGGEGATLTEENIMQILEQTLHVRQKERCRQLLQENGSVDYSYEVSLNSKPIRYRVQAYYSMGKPAVAMRRIRYEIPTFEQLHLPPIYKTVMENPEQKGIIIVGGETGSGKSSTLAAMIGYLSRHTERHFVTIEDPVEFVFRDTKTLIHQRELGLDFPNYAEALRAVLREDPDVIMIGEMRDADTVHAAIKAAETGHLVLTSLHTATAAWTFSRILNFFKEAEHDAVRLNLSYNLLAIMNQMLIPSEQKGIGLIPATEVFINTPSVRQYLKEKEKESQLADVIKEGHDGMHSFNMSLARLISEGHIGVTQAKSYSHNPQELEMLVKVTKTK
ncbi:MAG TPA: PilT/PilU family type 4a pilus ATPase [Anaerohalosphaeraceae bacterium]|nr:PilT/PilU family type 4a pilus ATPase [Anaerohalosphaeraceae bacterium]HOM76372.1 PilT/PilU family type 4a pilus ATPase [Anaerohalosphaeraceae bacterium]HPC64873.1 PilT/PilU family type 4a pilus ATPase [Anaerohalosphaeraceae bacterium]HPO70159.1 PilT/PilU family type 4a pilus ATPase [Anaerohalosphaeraceae bacterium]HRS72558.1 PilT/PilU family type 4a pilus ATPase [Anaerohalosphaeraceae bacterium]